MTIRNPLMNISKATSKITAPSTAAIAIVTTAPQSQNAK
jgi:hypothetical protein